MKKDMNRTSNPISYSPEHVIARYQLMHEGYKRKAFDTSGRRLYFRNDRDSIRANLHNLRLRDSKFTQAGIQKIIEEKYGITLALTAINAILNDEYVCMVRDTAQELIDGVQ
jgi:hypothetical protein